MKYYQIKLKNSVKLSLDGANVRTFEKGGNRVNKAELALIKEAYKSALDGKPVEVAAPTNDKLPNDNAGEHSELYERVGVLEQVVEDMGEVIKSQAELIEQLNASKAVTENNSDTSTKTDDAKTSEEK